MFLKWGKILVREFLLFLHCITHTMNCFHEIFLKWQFFSITFIREINYQIQIILELDIQMQKKNEFLFQKTWHRWKRINEFGHSVNKPIKSTYHSFLHNCPHLYITAGMYLQKYLRRLRYRNLVAWIQLKYRLQYSS